MGLCLRKLHDSDGQLQGQGDPNVPLGLFLGVVWSVTHQSSLFFELSSNLGCAKLHRSSCRMLFFSARFGVQLASIQEVRAPFFAIFLADEHEKNADTNANIRKIKKRERTFL